jgi:hypothetical protein
MTGGLKLADKSHISERDTSIKSVISEMPSIEVFSGRKKLLEITEALIDDTYDRISGDRFRLREGDREKLAYLRTLISLIVLYDSLLKDSKAPSLEGMDPELIDARHQAEKAQEIYDRERREMFAADLRRMDSGVITRKG